MAKVEKSININTPVEKVFAYVTDPTKMPEWMVSVMEVSDITGSGVDQQFRWKYRMIGIPLEGECTTTEWVPNERVVAENKGGIRSKFAWTYTGQQGGTKLDLQVEYTIPIPVLGKMAEKLVLKRNEREADMWMENIKEALEV